MDKTNLIQAQRAIFRAGNTIGDAGMRLEGTKYEKDYERLWNALNKLNSRLVKDIRS